MTRAAWRPGSPANDAVMSGPPDPRLAVRAITRIADGIAERGDDALAVERALEMRVDGRPLVVTLCTPGHDQELALGFLAGEGLIARRADAASVREVPAACADQPDAVDVSLAVGVPFDWTKLERHFAATAACGLCGRAHLDSLRAGLTPIASGPPIDAGTLAGLPGRLRESVVVDRHRSSVAQIATKARYRFFAQIPKRLRGEPRRRRLG